MFAHVADPYFDERVQVLLQSGKKLLLRIPTLLPELSSVSSIISLSSDHFPAALGMHTDDSTEDILRTLYSGQQPAISTCCGCREKILRKFSRQKRRIRNAKIPRTELQPIAHVSSQAAVLCIKKKYPVLKGFAHAFLNIENKLGKQLGIVN